MMSGFFAKNTYKLLTGTAFSQVVTFLSTFYFANKVGNIDFGSYIFIISTTFLAASVILLKLDVALQVEVNKIRFKAIYFIATVFLFFVIVLMLLIASFIYFIYFFENFVFYFLLIFNIFFHAYSQLSSFLLTSKGSFGKLAIFRSFKAVLIFIFQFIFIYFQPDYQSLVIGNILGCLFSLLFLKENIHSSLKISFFKRRNYLKLVVIRKFPFIKYQMPMDFLLLFNQQLPVYFLKGVVGAGGVGIYGMTIRILQAPVTLFSMSIKQTFLYELKNAKLENRKLHNMMIMVTVKLLLSTIIFSPILVLCVNYIFDHFMSDQWSGLKTMFVIVLPLYMFIFSSTPSTALAIIDDLQKKLLHISLISFFFRFFSLFISWILTHDIYISIFSFVFVSILSIIVQILIIFFCSKRKFNNS